MSWRYRDKSKPGSDISKWHRWRGRRYNFVAVSPDIFLNPAVVMSKAPDVLVWSKKMQIMALCRVVSVAYGCCGKRASILSTKWRTGNVAL